MVSGKYCFDEESFSEETFDVGTFLENYRTRNPMETIYQDLKQFQAALENQLVSIIDKDYAEFLQLSSKLKDVDEAVSSVRAPILVVIDRVDDVQHTMKALHSKIQRHLQMADDLHQQKKDLQLSIEISQKLLLLEDLLQIELQLQCDDKTLELSLGGQNRPLDLDEDSDIEFENFEQVKNSLFVANTVESCAKLERAAQIFIQLDLELIKVTHLDTFQNAEKRLAVIEETLLHRLETEFTTEIFPDTFYDRDHAFSAVTLSFLLRAYVLLNKSRIPEEMITRLIVQPFIEEHLTRSKLDGRIRGSCEGIAHIYESILHFITSKFSATLALPICQVDSKCSVDILGNAIWKPIQEHLSTKHEVIFQAADSWRFHQCYTMSMRFLADVEDRFCTSEIVKIRFRSHESVVQFKEKWNIEVYFQLQAVKLASSLEKSIGIKRDNLTFSDAQNSTICSDGALGLTFESSKCLWQAMHDCWSDHTFLAPLLSSFCKLCVQLLTYYIDIWTEPLLTTVAEINNGSVVDIDAMSLVVLPSYEDVLFAASDFHLLHEKISNDLQSIVESRICAFIDDNHAFVIDLFQEPLASLANLEASCWSTAVTNVIADCKKVLPAIRTVKGQYQMTNKPSPSTPSSYISNIVRPIQEFFRTWGVYFDVDKKQNLLQAIVEEVCNFYLTLSLELLRSASELEESLRSRKLQRRLGSSSNRGNNVITDTEKMRMQLLLDLKAMEREVVALGLNVQRCEVLQAATCKLSESNYSRI
ncbi:putative COG complex component, COG2, oligomeric Golgi complex, subunit 2 [Plasmopara halstedii]